MSEETKAVFIYQACWFALWALGAFSEDSDLVTKIVLTIVTTIGFQIVNIPVSIYIYNKVRDRKFHKKEEKLHGKILKTKKFEKPEKFNRRELKIKEAKQEIVKLKEELETIRSKTRTEKIELLKRINELERNEELRMVKESERNEELKRRSGKGERDMLRKKKEKGPVILEDDEKLKTEIEEIIKQVHQKY